MQSVVTPQLLHLQQRTINCHGPQGAHTEGWERTGKVFLLVNCFAALLTHFLLHHGRQQANALFLGHTKHGRPVQVVNLAECGRELSFSVGPVQSPEYFQVSN